MRCARCGREVLAESGEFFEEDSPVPDDKIREIRLRQMAEQQGLVLVKTQHWASHASGWGLYWPATVADTSGPWPSRLLVSPDVGLTLDGVEEFLTYGTTRAAIIEYLIRSYGPIFVEELTKHLPQHRANASNLGQE